VEDVTGPGYFVAKQASDLEVVIDDCEVPSRESPSWPAILPNSARRERSLGREKMYNAEK